MADRRFGDILWYNPPDGKITLSDRYLMAMMINPPGGDAAGLTLLDTLGIQDSGSAFIASFVVLSVPKTVLARPLPALSVAPKSTPI